MSEIELTDTSIIKLRPCRLVRESADRFGIVRRAGLSRVVVRGTGLAACELFRGGCTIGDAKRHLAKRSQVAEKAIDLNPLLRSLQRADLIASVDGKQLREACPPSLYSAYRYYLRFHIAPRLLHLAYRKLPISLGKHLAYSVQRLDLVGSLRPRAVQAAQNFESCPPHCKPQLRRQKFEKRYFSHLLQNIVDFQCLEAMTPAQVEDWFTSCVEYDGFEHLASAKRDGSPVILGGFHFSSTKLIPLLLMRRGYDITQVWLPDGRFDIDSVEKRVDELRKIKPGYGGFSNISDFSLPSYRRLIQSVRSGEVLVWFGDMFGERKQHEANSQSEEWRAQAAKVFGFAMVGSEFEQSKLPVLLCGRQVYLNSWIGAFARMTGAAVVPAALIRHGSRMKMIFKPALRLPSRATAKDVEALNRALFSELDLLLRLYPDQWFGWHSLNPVRESEMKTFGLQATRIPFGRQVILTQEGGENT